MVERLNTKQLLIESIKELMNEKSLDNITVKMITDNCHVTRQTFYNHFKDKFDLVNWIFCTNIDNIISKFYNDLPWSSVLAKMLIWMKREEKFFINALGYEGQNSFKQIITEYTRAAYARELKKRLNSKDLSNEMLFSIEFNSYGAVGIIYDWIQNNMITDPCCLAQNIANNMPECMKKYFQ